MAFTQRVTLWRLTAVARVERQAIFQFFDLCLQPSDLRLLFFDLSVQPGDLRLLSIVDGTDLPDMGDKFLKLPIASIADLLRFQHSAKLSEIFLPVYLLPRKQIG